MRSYYKFILSTLPLIACVSMSSCGDEDKKDGADTPTTPTDAQKALITSGNAALGNMKNLALAMAGIDKSNLSDAEKTTAIEALQKEYASYKDFIVAIKDNPTEAVAKLDKIIKDQKEAKDVEAFKAAIKDYVADLEKFKDAKAIKSTDIAAKAGIDSIPSDTTEANLKKTKKKTASEDNKWDDTKKAALTKDTTDLIKKITKLDVGEVNEAGLKLAIAEYNKSPGVTKVEDAKIPEIWKIIDLAQRAAKIVTAAATDEAKGKAALKEKAYTDALAALKKLVETDHKDLFEALVKYDKDKWTKPSDAPAAYTELNDFIKEISTEAKANIGKLKTLITNADDLKLSGALAKITTQNDLTAFKSILGDSAKKDDAVKSLESLEAFITTIDSELRATKTKAEGEALKIKEYEFTDSKNNKVKFKPGTLFAILKKLADNTSVDGKLFADALGTSQTPTTFAPKAIDAKYRTAPATVMAFTNETSSGTKRIIETFAVTQIVNTNNKNCDYNIGIIGDIASAAVQKIRAGTTTNTTLVGGVTTFVTTPTDISTVGGTAITVNAGNAGDTTLGNPALLKIANINSIAGATCASAFDIFAVKFNPEFTHDATGAAVPGKGTLEADFDNTRIISSISAFNSTTGRALLNESTDARFLCSQKISLKGSYLDQSKFKVTGLKTELGANADLGQLLGAKADKIILADKNVGMGTFAATSICIGMVFDGSASTESEISFRTLDTTAAVAAATTTKNVDIVLKNMKISVPLTSDTTTLSATNKFSLNGTGAIGVADTATIEQKINAFDGTRILFEGIEFQPAVHDAKTTATSGIVECKKYVPYKLNAEKVDLALTNAKFVAKGDAPAAATLGTKVATYVVEAKNLFISGKLDVSVMADTAATVNLPTDCIEVTDFLTLKATGAEGIILAKQDGTAESILTFISGSSSVGKTTKETAGGVSTYALTSFVGIVPTSITFNATGKVSEAKASLYIAKDQVAFATKMKAMLKTADNTVMKFIGVEKSNKESLTGATGTTLLKTLHDSDSTISAGAAAAFKLKLSRDMGFANNINLSAIGVNLYASNPQKKSFFNNSDLYMIEADLGKGLSLAFSSSSEAKVSKDGEKDNKFAVSTSLFADLGKAKFGKVSSFLNGLTAFATMNNDRKYEDVYSFYRTNIDTFSTSFGLMFEKSVVQTKDMLLSFSGSISDTYSVAKMKGFFDENLSASKNTFNFSYGLTSDLFFGNRKVSFKAFFTQRGAEMQTTKVGFSF
jgi:hypothetical protein